MIYDYNSYTRYVKIPRTKIVKMGLFPANGKTVKQWYDSQSDKPTVACNASFFEKKGTKLLPIYSLKIASQTLIADSLYKGMYINGKGFGFGTIQTAQGEHFVSGAPVIRENKINQVSQAWIDTLNSISGNEPRTIVGWDNDSFYVMAVDGRQTNKYGIKMSLLNGLCEKVGMDYALNFDGGGSTMLVYKGNIINSPCEYRVVYSIFAVWFDDDDSKITKIRFNDTFSLTVNSPISYTQKIAPNYSFYEVCDPTNREYIYDSQLMDMMQVLSTEKKWTINIASCYRGEKYNEDIGGEDNSYHTKGQAIDFKATKNGIQISTVCVGYALLDLLKRFNIAGGIGVYMPHYSADEPQSLGFNHFDTRSQRSLWVCYQKPTLVSISSLDDIKI